jgi:tetratricopeptide (TPR) repeat protein
MAQSRQQTLRTTLDWSYALLSEAERSLLKRLSVFAGGCCLDAAEQVCGGEGVPAGQVLDLLTSLVDKSLILFEQRESAEGRYRLLEMVRQYAAEGLQAGGEAEQVKTRHRDWFLALAEAAEPQLTGANQARWLRRMEAEHDNLRTALAHCHAESQGAQAGLRFVGALCHFWNTRGEFDEGRVYLERALEREGAREATAERAKALNGAGILASRQGDLVSAKALNEEGLTIQRELGDKRGIAISLNNLGTVAHLQSDWEGARTLFEESLAVSRELAGEADKGDVANSLIGLGLLSRGRGDYASAWTLLQESLVLRRELEDKTGIALSLYYLGTVTLAQGDYASTRALLQESQALLRETGHSYIIHVLGLMGHVERDAGDYGRASAVYQESLRLRLKRADVLGIACSLEDFAGLAGRQGQFERAVRLLGATEGRCATLGRTLPVAVAAEYERTVAAARDALGEAAFSAAWEEGRAMTLGQAVAFALEVPSDREPTPQGF